MQRGNRLAPGGQKNCAETDSRFFVSITVSTRYPASTNCARPRLAEGEKPSSRARDPDHACVSSFEQTLSQLPSDNKPRRPNSVVRLMGLLHCGLEEISCNELCRESCSVS
jgi:hypothetical protein